MFLCFQVAWCNYTLCGAHMKDILENIIEWGAFAAKPE